MSGVALRFLKQIQQVRPKWRAQDVKFSQITCACSNTIFQASHGQDKLLLRIYGSTDHGLFTREQEVRQTTFLSSHGFGARVLQTFDEGRIESWLEGRTPSHEYMRSSGVVQVVAKQLRALHDKTGMNHNDLHHNNMLVADDGSIELLDFEYAGPADPTYDIANHFNEWMYPYSGPEPHLFKAELYPSKEQRREFCSSYLGNVSGKGALVDDFLDQVEKRRQDSHAFWVNWAEKTPNEFNDAYAEARQKLLHDIPEEDSPYVHGLNHGLGTLRTLLNPRQTQNMGALLRPAGTSSVSAWC